MPEDWWKTALVRSLAFWGLILVLTASAWPGGAAAQSDEKTYLKLNPTHSFEYVLRQAMELKSRVTLHLRSGVELGGHVAGVDSHHVVIKGLTQRDFYDATVRISEIAAIEARARDTW